MLFFAHLPYGGVAQPEELMLWLRRAHAQKAAQYAEAVDVLGSNAGSDCSFAEIPSVPIFL